MADESSQRTSAESGEGTCTPSGPAAAAGDVAAHVHGHHAGAHHEHHAGDDGALAAARATTAAQHAAALAALAREHARDAAEAAWLAHPDTAARYLVAHNGHWAPAAKGLLATLEWRRTHAAAPLYCAPCAADPGSHAFVPLGVDAAGRGVVYGCHARARNQEATGMVRHVVHSVERVQEVTGVSQWRWVIDFAGFSMRQALQVRMATHAVTTLSTHLPETLHSAIVLNPPPACAAFLSVLLAILPARTAAKMTIIKAPTADEVEAALLQRGWPPEAARWVGLASVMPPLPLSLPALPADGHRLLLAGVAPPCAPHSAGAT